MAEKVTVIGIYYGSHKRYGIDEPEASPKGRREEVLLEESLGDWPEHEWPSLAIVAFLSYDEEMRNSGAIYPCIKITNGIKTKWYSARQLRDLRRSRWHDDYIR